MNHNVKKKRKNSRFHIRSHEKLTVSDHNKDQNRGVRRNKVASQKF